ncbi:MAG: hypothetical protein JKY95_08085 [Planctomycetaceae bacterium]|nr:hypothetical protein [Planctomycetaceae bacterium]
MNRQMITMWIAGLMVGSGSGLIIARSLPGTQNTASSTEMYAEQPREANHGAGIIADERHLIDPLQFPGPGLHTNPLAGNDLSSIHQNQTERTTFPPRLLPQGEASPVVPQETRPETTPQPALDFRETLKEDSPEFSEKILNDIANLRKEIGPAAAEFDLPDTEIDPSEQKTPSQ